MNGVDVLEKLTSTGTFSQAVPRTSREVSVTATGRHGVSQTTAFGITPLSSKRLFMLTVAQTPTAKTQKTMSARMPKAKARRLARR